MSTDASSNTVQFLVNANIQASVDNVRIIDDNETSVTSYSYDDANELTSLTKNGTAVSFTYDAKGRTTEKTSGSLSTTYTYAYDDRLASISTNFPGESAVSYGYDAERRRISRTSGGVTTNYKYDGGWNVLSEVVTGATKTYIPGLAEVTGTDLSSGTYSYYATDNLGSTRGLYNAAKANIGTYEYTPYGDDFLMDGPAITRKYTGHLWDSAAGMYWTPYRWYMPGAARWNMRDPEGMIDGPNMYGYVGGSPTNANDPLGLDQHTIGLAYGYGIKISWGNNNGVRNFNFGVGYGIGAMYEYNPNTDCSDVGRGYDTGMYFTGGTNIGNAGLDATFDYHGSMDDNFNSQVGIRPGYSVGFRGSPFYIGHSADFGVKESLEGRRFYATVDKQPTWSIKAFAFAGPYVGVRR